VRFSFIVTVHNGEDKIRACLMRLAACLKPQDQLIVVDDGSTDRSCEEITAAFHALEGREIEICPVFLGSSTPGGTGGLVNLGLAEVTGEALVLLDCQDLVHPAGLDAARVCFEKTPCDLLMASAMPSEGRLAQRDLALQIGTRPAGAIYRSAFLKDHGIRFPEGPFFYSDHVFHWSVCLAAQTFGFVTHALCDPKTGPDAQGFPDLSLLEFFDHYARILQILPHRRYRKDVLRWLLQNMAWHIQTLTPPAYWLYVNHAAAVFAQVPKADWLALQADPEVQGTLPMAQALARGDLAAVVATWQNQALLRQLEGVQARLAFLEEQSQQVQDIRSWVEGQRAVQEFTALKALTDETKSKER